MSAWHPEACALRAEGWTLSQLAKRFGVSIAAIQYATDPHYRRRQWERAWDRRRARAAARAEIGPADAVPGGGGPGALRSSRLPGAAAPGSFGEGR